MTPGHGRIDESFDLGPVVKRLGGIHVVIRDVAGLKDAALGRRDPEHAPVRIVRETSDDAELRHRIGHVDDDARITLLPLAVLATVAGVLLRGTEPFKVSHGIRYATRAWAGVDASATQPLAGIARTLHDASLRDVGAATEESL